LLVISNDKLRHQFGNLKMREAFEKADNVLATAAKCITDVINTTGQINVDFADVCTVMRNGGVAILGSSAAAGENRAHKAIEEALNSPLLNDNDISGAKWILININSAEGENEFTMDEVEIIQNHLVSRAGEGTDVILGLGYDSSLGDKIGITLIATGFQHKDPFIKTEPRKVEPKKDEKIVMVLGAPENDDAPAMKIEEEKKTMVEQKADPRAPKLVEDHIEDIPMPTLNDSVDKDHIKEAEPLVLWQLQENKKKDENIEKLLSKNPVEVRETTVGKMLINENRDDLHSVSQATSISLRESPAVSTDSKKEQQQDAIPSPAASGGYQLARPSNIYAESQAEVFTSTPSAEKPVSSSDAAKTGEDIPELQMQLVERDIPAADMPLADQAQPLLTPEVEDPAMRDEADEQKRRAAERLHKLRNLSFNVNSADPNNEFETVPAYIRRNMELYNSNSHIESFYSNYEVKAGKDNQAQISTINTFLDGKKPD